MQCMLSLPLCDSEILLVGMLTLSPMMVSPSCVSCWGSTSAEMYNISSTNHKMEILAARHNGRDCQFCKHRC